jgi:single-stranded DNA-binding protein
VILIGNLTKDAESLPSSGKPMTRMRLATNSIWRDSEANRLNRPSSASIGG